MRYLPKSFVGYPVLKSQDQVLLEVAKMDMQLNLHSKLKMDFCIHLRRVSSFCQSLLHSSCMRRYHFIFVVETSNHTFHALLSVQS